MSKEENPSVAVEMMPVPVGSRIWAQLIYDAGEEVEPIDDADTSIMGSSNPHLFEYKRWRRYTAPLQPIVLQPGSLEYVVVQALRHYMTTGIYRRFWSPSYEPTEVVRPQDLIFTINNLSIIDAEAYALKDWRFFNEE